jgi:N-methylhydantoinase B
MSTSQTTENEPPALREPGFWDGLAHSYIPSPDLCVPASVPVHEAVAEDVDPVTREVLRYALMNANFEHAALLQRLCVSPIVMLTRDFQTSILTEVGDLVFLGPNLQYFSNSHSLSIKYVLEHRAEAVGIAPGDMFLSNDPFVGAPHQPDTALLAPVFVGEELFCWVANTLHYADVGGSTPGSFCIDAADTWAEPLSWPPVKLIERDRLREDVAALFARQSRLPGALQMDMRAAIAGNQVTRARVLGLLERYGADTVKAVMLGTMDAAEALFAERLRSIPDGTFSQRGFAEAALPGDDGVYAYQINITKRGERLIVDNRGTDPQAGSINVTYAAFSGAVLAAITQSMTSDLSGAYGGVYRRVEFRPEPGLLNCADYPAAVSPSGALTTELQLLLAISAVAKMLSCGDEHDRSLILGPNLPHFYGTIQGGADASGTPFIFPNTNGMMGSLGGMPERDGVDVGGHFWIPEGIANNVEDMEADFPLVVLYRRLLAGGADGAGRHRGGLGFVEATMSWNAAVYQMALSSNESFAKGAGLFGANPGSRSSTLLRRGTSVVARMRQGAIPASIDELDGEAEPLGPKPPAYLLSAGDVWEWVSPSTGGWGDPLRREPDAVLADHRAGLISPEAALRAYGVALSGDGVDHEATRQRRLELRRDRLGGREPGEGVAAPRGARRVGDILHVVEGRWWCNGADLGPVSGSYRDHVTVRELATSEIAEEFTIGESEAVIAGKMVFREFLCPVTGYRIDTELARAGEPPLHDITLAG